MVKRRVRPPGPPRFCKLLTQFQSRTNISRRKDMDLVQPSAILVFDGIRDSGMECSGFSHSGWSHLAGSLHILLHRLVHQRPGRCWHGEAWRSLPHWLSRTMSLSHGVLWIHVLRLHSGSCWSYLVRNPVILRCKPDVDLPQVHIRTQVGQLGKSTACIGRRDL
jgi:hypothetical protein